MKDDRSTFDALRFTPEEKQAMVEQLLAAAPAARQRVSRKKRVHLLLAAVLAAALCAACASGTLQAAAQAFGLFLGHQPEQTQLLGDLAQPIGASVSDNGVTLTVDAVIGDANSYAILYTLSRDDGGPLFPGVDDPAILNLTDLRFDENLTELDPEALDETVENGYNLAGFGSWLRSSGARPEDNAVHFFELFHYAAVNGIHSPATATFRNLRARTVSLEQPEQALCLEGNWTVEFSLDCKDTSRDLPTGQVFHDGDGNSITGTIQSFRISPLSLCVKYTFTFDEEQLLAQASEEPRRPGESFAEWLDNRKIDAMPDHVTLTFEDGTQEAAYLGGDLTKRNEGKAILSGPFETILPLDRVKSITIGDLTVEMPQ